VAPINVADAPASVGIMAEAAKRLVVVAFVVVALAAVRPVMFAREALIVFATSVPKSAKVENMFDDVALSNVDPPTIVRPPVIVVVARVDAPAERVVAEREDADMETPESDVPMIDPPVIVGLVTAVLASWPMFCEADGNDPA